MALTPARIGALALIAAAAAATWLLPPEPRRLERSETYLSTAARATELALASARRAVTVRIVRDSVRAAAGRASDGQVRTVFDGTWEAREREWLSARVREIVGEEPWAAATAMAFVRDTTIGDPSPALYYALPGKDGDACVAIYAERAARARPLYRRAGPALLGPCAYYFRFGSPGGAVDAWLRTGGSALAITSPGYAPPRWQPPRGSPRELLLATLRGEGQWWWIDQQLEFPLSLNACLAGREEGCRAFVTGTRAGNRSLRALGIHSQSPWIASSRPATYLSDLLTEIGPVRFASFWRHDGTFEEAFASAVGTDLGTWTRGWVHARIGRGPGRPTVGVSALGTSVGAVGLFLALAVLVANRRRAH
jgi:hypothetical protein